MRGITMKKRKPKKLNFFRESFITDVTRAQCERALPLVHECMPRIHLTMTDRQLHCMLNAIVYLSTFYSPWTKIEGFKAIQRCYYRLKRRHYLTSIQQALGLQHKLDLRRPVRKSDPLPVIRRRRKCPECPACHQDAMTCYGSHQQGFALVRHYRCDVCGHTAVWITTENHQWWKAPRTVKNAPTFCY